MTDPGDIPELDELEPLEEADAQPTPEGEKAAPPSVADRTLALLSAGLAPPANNPNAEKEYYRFLFAGVVMFLGCMMPFGPEWGMSGYKTFGGAIYTLISIGMIWSWWGAIHRNRFSGTNLKWVLLALLPFFMQLVDLIFAFEQPAVIDAKNMATIAEGRCAQNWGDVFGNLFGMIRGTAGGHEASNFFRAFGPGKVVLFVGALLAEVAFMRAIVGGAKAAKAQKKARQAGTAGRRRR